MLTAEGIAALVGGACVLILVVAAVILDYKIHKANLAHVNAKAYRPDLRIWGIGFFTGAGLFTTAALGYTIQKIVTCPIHANGELWPHIAPIILLAVVIGLLAWGLIALCQSE